ncbi:hypothetical protein LOAG_15525 [Loa loa]|uniref:Uncharacterized protein n=1 Tax=Loa loa TaxID=7209 RepID=A0A1S0TFN5_LOALO|nr:hypothetical protein LOAG_15525 [Loa loa]EFO13006.1 hypothetical protein LOAG_15525 [Loa loa]
MREKSLFVRLFPASTAKGGSTTTTTTYGKNAHNGGKPFQDEKVESIIFVFQTITQIFQTITQTELLPLFNEKCGTVRRISRKTMQTMKDDYGMAVSICNVSK